jgi:hypothetical protein
MPRRRWPARGRSRPRPFAGVYEPLERLSSASADALRDDELLVAGVGRVHHRLGLVRVAMGSTNTCLPALSEATVAGPGRRSAHTSTTSISSSFSISVQSRNTATPHWFATTFARQQMSQTAYISTSSRPRRQMAFLAYAAQPM